MSYLNTRHSLFRGFQPSQDRDANVPSALSELDAMRDQIKRKAVLTTILPLSESEQKALFHVMLDQVLRLTVMDDGAVWVVGLHVSKQVSAKPAAESDDQKSDAAPDEDPVRVLCQETAYRAPQLIADYLATGQVQIFELQLKHEGPTTFFEVRAVASEPNVLIAVIRDVTQLKNAEQATGEELARINEVLRAETLLRDEQAEVIRNSYTKLHDLLEDTIEAISMIVLKKDPDTARHQERVCQLACAIGREMGLPPGQVDVIGLASLLHDLGKVFVPPRILSKTAQLDEAELAEIRNHAEAEYEILNSIDLLAPMAEIIHQHHERLNGSGYPRGLGGDDILLEARVMAVADVVEAMLSDRPHRPSLSVAQALEEMSRGRGTLFDGRAVNACIRLFQERGFTFDEVEPDRRRGAPATEAGLPSTPLAGDPAPN